MDDRSNLSASIAPTPGFTDLTNDMIEEPGVQRALQQLAEHYAALKGTAGAPVGQILAP